MPVLFLTDLMCAPRPRIGSGCGGTNLPVVDLKTAVGGADHQPAGRVGTRGTHPHLDDVLPAGQPLGGDPHVGHLEAGPADGQVADLTHGDGPALALT